MLKRESFKEVLDGVKIKIPTIEETEKLMKQLNKVAKLNDGSIDYDNPKAIYTLFKKLVVSDIKEIKNITEFEFVEAYHNPTADMEAICFEIGKIISDAIISVMRNNITQLIDTEMKLLQAQAVTKLNNISATAKEIEKSKIKN